MKNKYDIDFSVLSIKKNMDRLINQVWKLIPMRENDENWHLHLDSVILEVVGLNEVFCKDSNFLALLVRLEALMNGQTNFLQYRKVVFESINLIQKIKDSVNE